MKRRTFLQKFSLSTASLLGLNSAVKSSAHFNRSKKNSQPVDSRMLKLKGEYYRHHPVDFSKGAEGALGFKGWGESIDIEVPVQETALIPMHIWNIGFIPELPFSPEGQAGPVMEMLEWASRSVPIIKNQIPPILEAARNANIPIIHVASDEPYAKKYPGYQRTLQIAGTEPKGLPKAPRSDEKKGPDQFKSDLLFGKNFTEALPYYSPYIDFPEPAKPLDSEYVVFTTHQFNEVLRKHGIWNLIYIGFALNWCLWFSPCGMVDMSRLGYRCNCIKEGTTAVENKESVHGEFNKQQSLWRTSLMFGYIHSANDFIQSCQKITD